AQVPSDGRGRSCSSVGRGNSGRTVHPVAAEEMEAGAGLMWTLVKCLSGIRRGDHNRVRLEQSERKLALRTKLAARELERYEKAKAEQEGLERKQRAAERRRKNGLSDCGKIDWTRGKLFGPEHIIEERERQLKVLQKDLKLLKREFDISESALEGVTK